MPNIHELEQFKQYLAKHTSPGTVELYMFGINKWLKALNGGPVTPKAAQDYIDSLSEIGLSPNTVGVRAHAIMRFFRWKGTEIHLECPTISVGDPRYISFMQFMKLVNTSKSQLEKTLLVVLFDTAVRISELLGLKLDDVDREYKLIEVVRKGGKKQQVNISDKALAELDKWIGMRRSDSNNVFMGLTYNEALSIIKESGKRLGEEMTPHMLRHSRAVYMLLNNATLHDVQQHLGHASIATTANIYGKFKALDTKKRITPW